jgi:hypothetical protein
MLCLLLLAALGAEARDRLYFFVDERGLVHFSNVPQDPRYRLWGHDSGSLPRFDDGVEPLVLTATAPDTVARGGALDVSLALPASAGVRGEIEIRFDPAALRFEAATVDADLIAPDRLRLPIDPGIAAAFAADIRFAVRADAPERTVMRTSVIDLESEERRALRSVAGAPLVVRLTPP